MESESPRPFLSLSTAQLARSGFVACVLSIAGIGIPAHASKFVYKLEGSQFSTVEFNTLQIDFEALLGRSVDGTITVDESRLSTGSLRNQTLWWRRSLGEGARPGSESLESIDVNLNNEIVSSSIGFDGPSPAFDFETSIGATFWLRTDEHRRPVEWALTILEGPPDLVLQPSGMLLEVGVPDEGFRVTGDRGTLSLVPVPPAAWLFGSGLAFILGLRRHLRSKGSSSPRLDR